MNRKCDHQFLPYRTAESQSPVLLATENAPEGKRTWYAMFPQLGAPLGFLCSTGLFLLLSESLTEAQFFDFGWRIPFIASSLMVLLGLYVRLKLTETPAFQHSTADTVPTTGSRTESVGNRLNVFA